VSCTVKQANGILPSLATNNPEYLNALATINEPNPFLNKILNKPAPQSSVPRTPTLGEDIAALPRKFKTFVGGLFNKKAEIAKQSTFASSGNSSGSKGNNLTNNGFNPQVSNPLPGGFKMPNFGGITSPSTPGFNPRASNPFPGGFKMPALGGFNSPSTPGFNPKALNPFNNQNNSSNTGEVTGTQSLLEGMPGLLSNLGNIGTNVINTLKPYLNQTNQLPENFDYRNYTMS